MLYRKKYFFLSISEDFSAAGGNHLSTSKSYPIQYWDSTNINFSLVPVNLAEANCPRDRIHAHDCLPITILSGAAASVCACAGVFSHVIMTPHFIFSWAIIFLLGMTKLRGLWFQGSHESRFSHVEDPLRMRIFSRAWLSPLIFCAELINLISIPLMVIFGSCGNIWGRLNSKDFVRRVKSRHPKLVWGKGEM